MQITEMQGINPNNIHWYGVYAIPCLDFFKINKNWLQQNGKKISIKNG